MRVFGGLGLALAAALAVSAGARAAVWLPPVDMSAPHAPINCGAFCIQPGAGGVDVAVDAGGNAIAAWTRRDELNNQVVQAAFRPAGGSFGPPVDLGTTTTDYGFPEMRGALADVAMDGAGNATVVWPHPAGANQVIQAATRPAGGSFAPPVDLSAASPSAHDSRIAISNSGHTVVAWSRHDGGHNIVEARSRPPGGDFAPVQPLSAGGQNALGPAVAVNELGAATVAWARSNGSNQVVQARVRPAGGAFAAAQDMSVASQDAFAPEVAIDEQGRSTVVWIRANGAGDNIVQSRVLSAAGAAGTGVDDVSNTGRDGTSAWVAVDAANTAVAVWHGCPTSTTAGCVVESASRPSGGSFGSVQTVAAAANNSLPAVSMSPAGDAIAVWVSSALGRIQSAVRPTGGTFGEAQGISPNVGGANAPALVVDSEGNALAGWAYTRPDPDDRQLAQTAALDGAAPALTSISVPVGAVAGSPLAMTAQAFDRWSSVAIEWSFGDAGTAAGTSVSHAWTSAGQYDVTVTARDATGQATSATRTVQVLDAPPPPPPGTTRPPKTLKPRILARWSVRGPRTIVKRLLVRNLPANARVVVQCRGRRCPFRRKRARRPRRGQVNVLRTLGRRRTLRRRQTLELRITAPQRTGKVVRYKIRRARRPATTTLCLPAGASKPKRC